MDVRRATSSAKTLESISNHATAGRYSHASGVLLGAGGVNVRALKVKAVRGDVAPTMQYRARTSERERK